MAEREVPSDQVREHQGMSDRNNSSNLVSILRELVACKDLHDEIEAAMKLPENYWTIPVELQAKRDDYARRKPEAWLAAREALRSVSETTTEHPPQLMAVVDKWQGYANALRDGKLPCSYSTPYRTIDAILSEVRQAAVTTEPRAIRSTEGTCTCPPHLDPLGCLAETCPRVIAARRAVKTSREQPCAECDYYRSTGLGECKSCGASLVHCPTCKTALAFDGDVCGLCFPVAQP
jgi:hypothetical protein